MEFSNHLKSLEKQGKIQKALKRMSINNHLTKTANGNVKTCDNLRVKISMLKQLRTLFIC